MADSSIDCSRVFDIKDLWAVCHWRVSLSACF